MSYIEKIYPNPVLRACLLAEPTFELGIIGRIGENMWISPDLLNKLKDTFPPESEQNIGQLSWLKEIAAWLNHTSQLSRKCSGPTEEIKSLALDAAELHAIAKRAEKKGLTDKEAVAVANELRECLVDLLKGLGTDEPSFDETGILTWDGILADKLAPLSDVGKKHAENIRENAKARRSQWELDHKAAGLWKVWTSKAYAKALAQALWPWVKAKKGPEPKGNTLMSRDLSSSIAKARFSGGVRVDTAIRVQPTKGFTLFLPLDAGRTVKGDEGTVSLRQHLDASALHTLLAAMQIYVDNGRKGVSGRFPMEESQILDAKGTKQRERNRYGNTYLSYRETDVARVREQLKQFSEIRVTRVGDFKMSGPDALLSEIERISTKEVWYRFSELIQMSLTENYYQIPRVAVRELPSDDIPLALGIGDVVRGKIALHLAKGKSIEATAGEYLETSGINYRDGQRKDGVKYWDKETARIIETSEKGGFGIMSQVGSGKDAVLTLAPSDVIKDGYAGLATAIDKRIRTTKQAKVSIEKDKLKKSR